MSTIHQFGHPTSPSGHGPGGAIPQPSYAKGPDVRQVLINYNEKAKAGAFHPVLFRETEIERLISGLYNLNHPNVLLTGEAGVGKTGLVEELAWRLASGDPVAKKFLPDAVIYELPLASLVAGKSFVGQLEEMCRAVIDFAVDPKNHAILYIDEVHQLFTSRMSTDETVTQILKPALSRSDLHVIASTTTQEARAIGNDPAFERRFSHVIVPELSPNETVHVLESLVPEMQKHYRILIKPDLLPKVVRIAGEHDVHAHRPDSAISLLNRACAEFAVGWTRQIAALTNSGQTAFAGLTNVALPEKQLEKSVLALSGAGKSLLRNPAAQVKAALDENIIGQPVAVKALTDTVRRMLLHLTQPKKPHSFLFAGATGTGKTEVAKQLARGLFGSENAMIYLNMTEFSGPASITRLIGSADGYVGSDSKRKLPFDGLDSDPYQVIVLDEFEKADTGVKRLFMQALDEGKIETNRHNTIDFRHAIIVATTNAGAEDFTKTRVGFTERETPSLSKSETAAALSRSFDPELLNRFEQIITFQSIGPANYKQIMKLKYNHILAEAAKNRSDFAFSPMTLDPEKDYPFINALAAASYNPAYNARPAERTVRRYVEDFILAHSNRTQFTFTDGMNGEFAPQPQSAAASNESKA